MTPGAPASVAPTALAVTGGAGALGRHFLRAAVTHTDLMLRVLEHRTAVAADLPASRVTRVRGSLLDEASLDRWLCPGAAVVHLAWSSAMTRGQHLQSVNALAAAAARHKVVRFVHCSTAVVAGRAKAAVVNEDTPCEPAGAYEVSKYEIEGAMESAARGKFPLVIVRPTAIFGPGLANLVSLVESLRSGRALVNYARSCVFGRRNLHLVPVETVSAAILFTALRRDGHRDVDRPVRYIVSADEEPANNFMAVEAAIRNRLALRTVTPRVILPPVLLRLLLRATGRSDSDPYRIYDGSRLRRAGFVPPVALSDALDRYAATYVDNEQRSAR